MNLPDFAEYGYSIESRLNQNLQGGRITYKGVEIATDTPVIIKQFRFATQQDWSAYKQVEREINILQGLEHPGIPRYLAQFDPGDGICLVQEYENAQDLSHFSSFSPEEIKDIAIQLLEILVYLQSRIPLIVHRDIKPENVLVEISSQSPLNKGGRGLKVYLVDFGFARIGGEVTALSSMVAGTTGFMPPEQMLNKNLTESSDLYGLGATLICLLTGKKSIELGELVDHTFRIDYQSLVSRYSLRFIDWLDLMVEPDVNKRFRNAQTALQALHPLDVIRVPKVKLDQSELQFTAQKIGERLTQPVTIINEESETVLEGKWSVSPHPSDPLHTPDDHSWIQFSPQQFRGNNVQCNVTVDTDRLKAQKNYEREIILRSNAEQENCYLKVKVRTATPIVVFKNPPYLLLAIICMISIIIVLNYPIIIQAIARSIRANGAMDTLGTILLLLCPILGAIGGVAIWDDFVDTDEYGDTHHNYWGGGLCGAVILTAIFGAIWSMITIDNNRMSVIFFGRIGAMIVHGILGLFSGAIWGAMSGWIVALIVGYIIFIKFKKRGFNKGLAWLYILLTGGLGISIAIAVVIGLSPDLILALAGTGLPLAGMLLYPPLRQRRLKAQYYRHEAQNLIEP